MTLRAHIRAYFACRRLAKHAAKNRADLERRGFVKRSQASRLGWQRRRQQA
jgi:hypothetical protein